MVGETLASVGVSPNDYVLGFGEVGYEEDGEGDDGTAGG